MSRLYRPLEADDTAVMRRALRAFGVLVDDNDDPWLVLGTGGKFDSPDGPVDVGASGTTARFITALAALVPGPTVVDGIERMRERPIGPLTQALGQVGVEATDAAGFPPVRVTGGGRLEGGHVRVDASMSSQFASALLMVAPMAEGPITIELEGPVVSPRYLDGTVEMMRRFGAEVAVAEDRYEVSPTGYDKAHVTIEPDASAAVYPAVAAAITGGHVEIPGLGAESTQPDLFVLEVLARMGCDVDRDADAVRVRGPAGPLTPVDVDLTEAPDGAMAVAVAALFAEGQSRLGGLSTLRMKETDRLQALETELRRVGGGAEIEGDSLIVTPGSLHGASIETYGDHRMAMSMALVGLVVEGVTLVEPGVVTKTWPGYYDMLGAL